MLRGEERAFDEFFAGHFPRLYRFAFSRLDQANEALQTLKRDGIDGTGVLIC